MFLYIDLVDIPLEKYSTGFASSHLVTYSTVVMIYRDHVCLVNIENGPMKLIAQISNVELGFTDIKGIYVLSRGRPIHCHWSHLFTNSRQSQCMVGHHNPNYWIFLDIVSALKLS